MSKPPSRPTTPRTLRRNSSADSADQPRTSSYSPSPLRRVQSIRTSAVDLASKFFNKCRAATFTLDGATYTIGEFFVFFFFIWGKSFNFLLLLCGNYIEVVQFLQIRTMRDFIGLFLRVAGQFGGLHRGDCGHEWQSIVNYDISKCS